MGGLFSKPKMPDMTPQIKAQEQAAQKQEQILQKQEERVAEQETEKTKQLQARRRAVSRGGRAALLSPERPNAEQGLQSTLGVGGM